MRLVSVVREMRLVYLQQGFVRMSWPRFRVHVQEKMSGRASLKLQSNELVCLSCKILKRCRSPVSTAVTRVPLGGACAQRTGPDGSAQTKKGCLSSGEDSLSLGV
jgi:hypothetical protein